jgi:hypothetical protein
LLAALACVVVGSLSTACARHASKVRERFTSQYQCHSVDVEEIGDATFRAQGCGFVATYTCQSVATPYGAMVGGAAALATTSSICIEERREARPARRQVFVYSWPPRSGRQTERRDDFARSTVVSLWMTVGERNREYAIRLGATPERGTGAMSLAVMAPRGGPHYAQCHTLQMIIAGELAHFTGGAHSIGPNREAITTFVLPANRLDAGLSRGVLKAKYCGVEWSFTREQVAALLRFRGRVQEIAASAPAQPLPAEAAPPVRSATEEPAPPASADGAI